MAPPDTSRSAAPPDPSVLRVRDPGELVAAIPVLLGFHPHDSLVLIATGGESGRRLGLTLRVDLPPPEDAAGSVGGVRARGTRTDAEIVGDSAVRGLLHGDPDGAAVIVVGPGSGADPPHRELVDLVVHALEGHRIDVHTVLWAAGTEAGACWACYDPCDCAGALPEPSATPLVAAAVAVGKVVLADRGELERMVAPAAGERIRRREVLLAHEVDEALSRSETGAGGPEPGWALVDAAIADADANRLVLDDARVVALALALADPAVRDAAMLRCAGSTAAAAEQLWTALVRETPDPEAAEPAVLLALSALLRGDGALANVALDRAARAWPGHRLAAILRWVAEAGIRPDQVQACLSHDDAGGRRNAGAPN